MTTFCFNLYLATFPFASGFKNDNHMLFLFICSGDLGDVRIFAGLRPTKKMLGVVAYGMILTHCSSIQRLVSSYFFVLHNCLFFPQLLLLTMGG
jgi:hypothetical protein